MPDGSAPTPRFYPNSQPKGKAMLRLALIPMLIGSPAFAQMQCGGYARVLH